MEDNFRKVEKLLYSYKTLGLAIKNLQFDIDTLYMPTCISNYSDEPVTPNVGMPSDSTQSHALRRVNSEVLENLKTRLAAKQLVYTRITEILELFTEDEMIIWTRRYIKDQDVAAIYDSVGWSKTTYFRIRKGLVTKVMMCLGEI